MSIIVFPSGLLPHDTRPASPPCSEDQPTSLAESWVATRAQEQDTCIDVRDVGNALVKIAKESLLAAASENFLETLKDKAILLDELIALLEALHERKRILRAISAASGAPDALNPRAPSVRPRRFRKQKKPRQPQVEIKPIEKETNKRNRDEKIECQMCGSSQSPEWRRGPGGNKTLCNACGLHYAKMVKQEEEADILFAVSGATSMSINNILN